MYSLGSWYISSPPIAAYMRQGTGSALVQVMACRLFGAEPLTEPMLVYCQLDSSEQISVKFESKFYQCIHENAFEIVFYQNGGHFGMYRNIYFLHTWRSNQEYVIYSINSYQHTGGP